MATQNENLDQITEQITSCSSPTVDQFAQVLSRVPSWYNLGVFLGIPTTELDRISDQYSRAPEGTLRCLIEVYKSMEREGKSLSWESIVKALRCMGNHSLADEIYSRYIKPQSTTQQHSTTTNQVIYPPNLLSKVTYTPAAQHADSSMTEAVLVVNTSVPVIHNNPLPPTSQAQVESMNASQSSESCLVIDSKEHKPVCLIANEYETLFIRLESIVMKVKQAVKSENVDLDEMQDVVRRQCDSSPLPQEVATVNAAFTKIVDSCSILNFTAITFIAATLLKNGKSFVKQLTTLKRSVDRFKSSANMVELVTLIKSKQTTPTQGQKAVVLKLRERWGKPTYAQFEIMINELFQDLQDKMTHITVTKGCICLNWIIPDINTTELVPMLPLEFVRLIGVIYLHIGNKTIYNIEGDGCESIEAAMLQAIELKNTRAIEFLLAVGCSPQVATYTDSYTVSNIVNIRSIDSKESSSGSSGSVDHVCILGHDKRVEAIVNPSEAMECTSCTAYKKMVKNLCREIDSLHSTLQQDGDNAVTSVVDDKESNAMTSIVDNESSSGSSGSVDHMFHDEHVEAIDNPSEARMECRSCTAYKKMVTNLSQEIDSLRSTLKQEKMKDGGTGSACSDGEDHDERVEASIKNKKMVEQVNLETPVVMEDQSRTDDHDTKTIKVMIVDRPQRKTESSQYADQYPAEDKVSHNPDAKAEIVLNTSEWTEYPYDEAEDKVSHNPDAKAEIVLNTSEWTGYPYDEVIDDYGVFVSIDHKKLKLLIIDEEMEVPIAPILLTLAGLPNSQKTTAIDDLFSHYGLSDAHTSAPVYPPLKHPGIEWYELVALCDRQKQEMYHGKNLYTWYLYAMYSKLSQKYQSEGQKMGFNPRQQNDVPLFSNDKLPMEASLNDLFERLQNHHHYDLQDAVKIFQTHARSTIESTNFVRRSLSTGVAFLNIWNIKLSKAVFYFLPLLSGQLSHGYLWLFFDLHRDAEKMHLPPDVPDDYFDHDVLMIWRSRLYYMMRHVYFTTGSNTTGESRCSMFPISREVSYRDHAHLLGLCKEQMRELAKEMKIEHLIDLDKEMHDLSISHDRIKKLKAKADELVMKGFKSPTMVPLSHIFFRDTLNRQLYFDKQMLQEQAKELNMDEVSFDKFCRFYISCGSIIDASLLGSQSPYIITKPILFFSKLDQIFNHNENHLVTLFGLFSFSMLRNLLGKDAEFFKNVLSSAGLGVEVRNEQISLPEAVSFPLFYIPIAGRKCNHKFCEPTALHLRLTGHVLIRNMQVAFTKEFLNFNSKAKLIFMFSQLSSKMNCTSFNFEGTQFDLVCHGNAESEFILPDSCTNDSVYEAILESCYNVLNQLIANDVFFHSSFAFICSSKSEKINFKFGRKRHLLPILDSDLSAAVCDKCKLELVSKPESQMWRWNKILKHSKFNQLLENDRYKTEFTSPQMSPLLLDKFVHSLGGLSDDTANQLALSMKFENGLQDPSLKDYKGWRRMSIMILEYERRFGPSMDDGKLFHYLIRKLKKLMESLNSSDCSNPNAQEDARIINETLTNTKSLAQTA